MRTLAWLACSSSLLVAFGLIASCSSATTPGDFSAAGAAGSAPDASDGSAGSGGTSWLDASSDQCKPYRCAEDHKSVIDCNGALIRACDFSEMCAGEQCLPACEASRELHTSVGCEYYPVVMGASKWTQAYRGCFAVTIANTWTLPVKLQVDRKGVSLDPSTFAYQPEGTGTKLQYKPFDASKGLQPGEVAILFLSGPPDPPVPNTVSADCPFGVTAATTDMVQVEGTGLGEAFHITTDYPVVAYQMLPYGAGSAGIAGASLLLPTSVWDTNYVAVNAYGGSTAATFDTSPSLNIVAMEDGTEVKLLPGVDVVGGNKIPAAAKNTVLAFTLNKGQFAQITQPTELTGSPIETSKPVGLMAGHECMFIPTNVKFCDHAEQQIPPVKALGHEYVAVPFRPRTTAPEKMPWRIIGGVDGTNLAFEPASVHGPKLIGRGEVLEFTSDVPFIVKSQDPEHPFILTGYMSGSVQVKEGYGDPDFVRMVPPQQYLQRYVFFTDPTFPETNLVMVRPKGEKGFADVKLDCAGVIDDWTPIGAGGEYEFARIDLVRHDFEPQNGCDNGYHQISSNVPFGLWVWGWGTPETSVYSQNVSYGYPAGENVVQLNNVTIPSIPK
jgi:hypothetical protein